MWQATQVARAKTASPRAIVAAFVGEDRGEGLVRREGADLRGLVLALGLELQILDRRCGGLRDGGIEVVRGDENAVVERAVFRLHRRGDEDGFLRRHVPGGVEGLLREFADSANHPCARRERGPRRWPRIPRECRAFRRRSSRRRGDGSPASALREGLGASLEVFLAVIGGGAGVLLLALRLHGSAISPAAFTAARGFRALGQGAKHRGRRRRLRSHRPWKGDDGRESVALPALASPAAWIRSGTPSAGMDSDATSWATASGRTDGLSFHRSEGCARGRRSTGSGCGSFP